MPTQIHIKNVFEGTLITLGCCNNMLLLMLTLMLLLSMSLRVHNHVDVLVSTAILSVPFSGNFDQIIQNSVQEDNWLLVGSLICPFLVKSLVYSFLLEIPKQTTQSCLVLVFSLSFIE